MCTRARTRGHLKIRTKFVMSSDQESSSPADRAVVEAGNGGPAVSTGEGEGQGEGQTPQQPQQPRRSGWDMLRTILFQVMIFYFISSFFRGRQTPPQNPDGTTSLAGSNLFTPGLELVSRTVYKTPLATLYQFCLSWAGFLRWITSQKKINK